MYSLTFNFGFALAALSVPVVHQMRHDVVRKGAIPCLGAALGVDGVLRVAELMEQDSQTTLVRSNLLALLAKNPERGGNNHRRAAMPLCSAKNRCVVIASWASYSSCMLSAA